MSRVYFAILLIFFLHISLICAILFSKAVEHMTVGEKIKKIRTFRGMTQKELGLAIGFEEKGADNRIAQYETNYRVPKRELLDKIAQALRVDRQNFYTVQPGCAEDFMRTFFWLDEDSPGAIRLFQLVRNPGKIGASDDTAVRYNDTDDWPAQPPVGIYFNYGLVVYEGMAFAPAGATRRGDYQGRIL
jgi:transcriptional regulator with XRE-family HTH domain